jgi:hypothetical protein
MWCSTSGGADGSFAIPISLLILSKPALEGVIYAVKIQQDASAQLLGPLLGLTVGMLY